LPWLAGADLMFQWIGTVVYIPCFSAPVVHWVSLPANRLASRKILIEQNIKKRTGPALCVLCGRDSQIKWVEAGAEGFHVLVRSVSFPVYSCLTKIANCNEKSFYFEFQKFKSKKHFQNLNGASDNTVHTVRLFKFYLDKRKS
jgi:hypothetical protein